MYRFDSSGSRVSIIWFMRSIPSVVTFRTWVSPRWNRPEPCALGTSPTSAVSGLISSVLRPSSRMPSSTIRRRMAFFCRSLNAGEICPAADSRPSGHLTTMARSRPP